MIAVIIILVIIIAFVAFFCLKGTVINSIATVISAIIALLVALNYFELLAGIMISKNYVPAWAHSASFIVLFVITMVLVRIASDQIVGQNIEYSDMAKYVAAAVCGILVGIIVSGALLIMLGMSPLSPGIPYARFDSGGSNVRASAVKPSSSMFADTFSAGLFSLASKGSLSSQKSFAVFHTDFIDQIHLNRCKAGGSNAITLYAGKNAIVVPPKIGVRIREDNRTVIRIGFSGSNIDGGGIVDENGRAEFALSQVRLICKEKDQALDNSGSAVVVYPEKCIIPGNTTDEASESLGKVVTFGRDEFSVQKSYGRIAWADLVFSVPAGTQPVMLQFKQNAVTDLPKPVNSTEEIEQQLNSRQKDG